MCGLYGPWGELFGCCFLKQQTSFGAAWMPWKLGFINSNEVMLVFYTVITPTESICYPSKSVSDSIWNSFFSFCFKTDWCQLLFDSGVKLAAHIFVLLAIAKKLEPRWQHHLVCWKWDLFPASVKKPAGFIFHIITYLQDLQEFTDSIQYSLPTEQCYCSYFLHCSLFCFTALSSKGTRFGNLQLNLISEGKEIRSIFRISSKVSWKKEESVSGFYR